MKTLKTTILWCMCCIFFMSCDKDDRSNQTSEDFENDPIVQYDDGENNALSNKNNEWTNVFIDNFNQGGNLNKWERTHGRNDYNSRICAYKYWNSSIQNFDNRSCLRLRSYKVNNNSYESGHVKSKFNFKPKRNEQYRVSAMIKFTAQDFNNNRRQFRETYGAWPAFWTVDESVWPQHGEIDIMEGFTFGGWSRYSSNLFYGRNFLQNEMGTSAERKYNLNDNNWHKYDMYWTNQNGNVYIDVFVDNNQVANYGNWVNPNLKLENFGPHNVILNMHIGSDNSLFDNTRINLFKNTFMWVDWVRVDKKSI